MPWTPNTALRAGASVAALASGALLLAACGSHSSGPAAPDAKSSAPASASASAAAGGAADMEAYRDCLARHGVKLPSFSPGARPSGRPTDRPSGRPSGGFRGGFGGGMGGASADPETQKAAQACASVRPTFHAPGGAGGADSSAIQAFTSCLKDHGVTLPSASPTSTARPRGGGFFGAGLDTADPKVAKAYDTCKPLLPQRPSASAT
jgi:hypothetical protein